MTDPAQLRRGIALVLEMTDSRVGGEREDLLEVVETAWEAVRKAEGEGLS